MRYQQQEPVKVVQLSDFSKPYDDKVDIPGTWQSAMARLAQGNKDQFKAWFSQLQLISFEAGILRLKAPSKFAQRYIETHLSGPLLTAVEAELGPVMRVEFEG